MRGAWLWRLAWRNLWRNPRRSLVLLAAVTLGTAATVFAAALMEGMVRAMVADTVAHLPGEIQLHAPGYLDDPAAERAFPYPDGALRAVLDGPLVAAWAARLRVPAVVTSEYDSAGLTLIGVEPARERGVSFVAKAPIEGRSLRGPEDGGLVLGARLLEVLESRPGRRLVVTAQGGDGALVDRGFRVVGAFRDTLEAVERERAYTGLAVAQAFLGVPGQVTEVAVRARDPARLEALVAALRQAAPELEVRHWRQLAPLAQVSERLYREFTWIWYLVVFVAMAFGLVNTFLMAVFERTRELGLLGALGMRPRWILLQVWLEAALLLALGLALGDLLAWGVIVALGEIDLGAYLAGAAFAGLAPRIPLALPLETVLEGNVLLWGLGLAAALYPAWRAARLAPVAALRGAVS